MSKVFLSRPAKEKKVASGLTKKKFQEVQDSPHLDWSELQELFLAGKIDFIRAYLETHYLGSKAQVWLMRTREVELIRIYLNQCSQWGLFEEAEELLMALKCRELVQLYLDRWPLRHHSLLMLFAENDVELLKRYIVKHPEEGFSRLSLGLMFELNDEALVRQYIKTHPAILKEERYSVKLKKMGFA